MYGGSPINENAAPLILSMLLRRRQIPVPRKEVLLSSTQPHALAHILAKAHGGAMAKPPSPPSLAHITNQRSAMLLKDLPGFAPAAPTKAQPALQVVALSTGPSQSRGGAAEALLSLPLTLTDVASLYRAQHRERLPPNLATGAAAHGGVPLALLEGKGVPAVQRECFDLHCRPGSKDLVLVDFSAGLVGDETLWEALLVAECALHEGGTLLAVSPHAFPQRVRRFLRWRFRNSLCAAAADGASHYAVCCALATDFGAASVRRDDFPGLFSAAKKRPRKWNPYRREEARKFVVSVRPGFTDAPHTKDALLRNVVREKDRDDRLRDADDAFFAVAHGMVERGTHYSQPND